MKYLLVFFAAIVLNGCKESTKAIEGEIVNGNYQNQLVGFTIDLPENWQATPRDELKEFVDYGVSTLSSINDSVSRAVEKADFQEIPLYMMYKDVNKTTTQTISSMVVFAAPLKGEDDFSSESDYLNEFRSVYEGLNEINMKFDDEYLIKEAQGKQFKVLKGSTFVSFFEIFQEYWCIRIEEEYMFTLIITYIDPKDRAEIYRSINASL